MRKNASRSVVAPIVAILIAAASVGACSSGADEATSADSGTRTTAAGSRADSATPHPAHVVVVMEENHAAREIIGNRDAPYLTALAAGGASMTTMTAIRHPSEPNYLALFSGSTQGLTDDSCPHRYHGADLATELLAAHRTFVGFAEGLPRTGYLGCSRGKYARKHSPWSNFPAVPRSVSRPLTAFPQRFSALPALSFVIPDLDHDMHDGTVAQADSWLQKQLGAYARWATANNSVLVVTWDEDDHSQGNHIPTIITGAHVRPGRYAEHADLYRLLRTLTWLLGVPPIGNAAHRSPITDIWR